MHRYVKGLNQLWAKFRLNNLPIITWRKMIVDFRFIKPFFGFITFFDNRIPFGSSIHSKWELLRPVCRFVATKLNITAILLLHRCLLPYSLPFLVLFSNFHFHFPLSIPLSSQFPSLSHPICTTLLVLSVTFVIQLNNIEIMQLPFLIPQPWHRLNMVQ